MFRAKIFVLRFKVKTFLAPKYRRKSCSKKVGEIDPRSTYLYSNSPRQIFEECFILSVIGDQILDNFVVSPLSDGPDDQFPQTH